MSRRAPSSWRRRVVVTLWLAALIVLLAHPVAGAASDVWGNVGPSPQVGGEGIAGRYPLTNYSLDQHFDAVEASLTGGVDVSGVPPMIAFFLASILWLGTSFLANLLITLFGFAFGLDLVNGSQATGGAGALAPVSRAIHSIYAGVLGEPWLVLAVAIAGIWAMWKALVLRRYSETAGALGLSLVYVVLALFFVSQPGATIGSVSKWTNEIVGGVPVDLLPRQRDERPAGEGGHGKRAVRPARLQTLGRPQLRRARTLRPRRHRRRGHRPGIGRGAAALLQPRPRRRARPPPPGRDGDHRGRQGLRQQREQVRAALPPLQPRRR